MIRELATLQTEMSRLMNGLFEGNGRTTQGWVPAVDVWENGQELVYAFDLPGVAEEDISVELHDDTLTVTAQRERTEERTEDGFVRFERRFGTFSRAVGVPAGVSEESIKADYQDGVLEIRVAKPEEPKPRRIQIGGGHPTIEGGRRKRLLEEDGRRTRRPARARVARMAAFPDGLNEQVGTSSRLRSSMSRSPSSTTRRRCRGSPRTSTARRWRSGTTR